MEFFSIALLTLREPTWCLVRKEAGVNYYGFPVAWKSVYGGVSARYNLTNFVIDILFWILVTYPMLILLFSALGWKQS